MNSCNELVIIFDRILNRVNQGAENYTCISNYIARRVEAEEKIISILKGIIPEKYDKNDPITKTFMQNLQEEIDNHDSLSKNIRNELVNKNTPYMRTMNEKQRAIRAQVEKAKNRAQKAISNTLKAQREVDLQKSKCKDLTARQLESQNANVRKAIQEYQNKSREEVDESLKISSSDIPVIYREFSDFDSLRLRKLHGLTLSFNQLKKESHKMIINSCDALEFKLNGFDPVDRSKRYIRRVYDTTIDVVQEDEDIEVYATAIADYRSNDPRDLHFVRGEKIKILNQHSSGWYEGQIENRRGYFPNTFVIYPGDLEMRKDPIGAVCLVTDDFEGPNRSDIKLLDGDLVYVDYCSKERCSGTNLRNNKRGYFPLSCLETRITSVITEDEPNTPINTPDWLPEYNESMELKIKQKKK
ncbi:hypothetical protein M9Y10_009227 [Tritrichomonas musculus]|uniref:SH3 domain-containing protein n=1 Tax=Tritrichomonas musculus TaxID=1915356 RepID=A0ABR2INP0_9EUKA